MTNQKILEKTIQKAIEGGWTDYNSLESLDLVGNTANTVTLKGWIEFVDADGNTDEGTTELTFNYKELIFNHDFAKVLWGEDIIENWYDDGGEEHKFMGGTLDYPYNEGSGMTYKVMKWKYHLQQMVLAPNPIKYLGENI